MVGAVGAAVAIEERDAGFLRGMEEWFLRWIGEKEGS